MAQQHSNIAQVRDDVRRLDEKVAGHQARLVYQGNELETIRGAQRNDEQFMEQLRERLADCETALEQHSGSDFENEACRRQAERTIEALQHFQTTLAHAAKQAVCEAVPNMSLDLDMRTWDLRGDDSDVVERRARLWSLVMEYAVTPWRPLTMDDITKAQRKERAEFVAFAKASLWNEWMRARARSGPADPS